MTRVATVARCHACFQTPELCLAKCRKITSRPCLTWSAWICKKLVSYTNNNNNYNNNNNNNNYYYYYLIKDYLLTYLLTRKVGNCEELPLEGRSTSRQSFFRFNYEVRMHQPTISTLPQPHLASATPISSQERIFLQAVVGLFTSIFGHFTAHAKKLLS